MAVEALAPGVETEFFDATQLVGAAGLEVIRRC
jgi:malonyl CoA-acyl carrier protein transacylase